MKSKFYSEEEVLPRLVFLSGWVFSGNMIHKEIEFKNFRDAFSFMTRVAFEAERMDHHPDWSNNYNRVRISLRTHSAGGVTDKDLQLAEEINRYAESKSY